VATGWTAGIDYFTSKTTTLQAKITAKKAKKINTKCAPQ